MPRAPLRSLRCACCRFGSILSKNGLDALKVLKLDCEGCEFEVAPQLDMKKIGIIVGECHKYPSHQPPEFVKNWCRKYNLRGV